MKPEKEKHIITSFPLLYKNINSIDCPDGWYDLIYDLSSKLEELIKQTNDDKYYVVQIKEKFGGLRFYISAGTDVMYSLITEAENKSMSTCEICGNISAEVKEVNNWLRTICENCYVIQDIIK